ncbi:39S ribosomal protein L49, mitochondrial [Strongyloides ratti]|uniref:Large ribosomal subunit protein mL49 n=1 Tax=Strongyloides ratti TaxID=34506 RepID=A0A090L6J2_STRRB|nr:39S ribosomal protein L49, mitochondrial [Strongyloides ratti]CEF63698.1 39S ribosomal protein L49, mitochondrial [Strongyloides ratti]
MVLSRSNILCRLPIRKLLISKRLNSTQLWEDPWNHALPKQTKTYTEVAEANIDWSLVERLMPIEVIPPMPDITGYSPSGWKAPSKELTNLPYSVTRRRDHMLPLYLQRRRDKLNEKTMDFEYVEIVTMRQIYGDVFACEKDLKQFLEDNLKHKVATSVDELKGTIKVKGADRSLLEKFLYEKGF